MNTNALRVGAVERGSEVAVSVREKKKGGEEGKMVCSGGILLWAKW